MQGVIDLYLIPKFNELGMSASGQWIESLEARIVDGNGEIWGMDYTYFLQNGRAPGAMPPVSALIPWVSSKLGKGGREGVSIAWAIAKKIQREGTEYYPDGTDLLDVLSSKEVIDYVYGRFGEAFRVEINKRLIKQLNDNFA
jgi:hypothetical protein